MSMRRFFLLAMAAAILTGGSFAPANTGLPMNAVEPVIVADDEPFFPAECGLFDPCRVSQTA